MRIFPTHHRGFPLPNGVEDGVGGVKDVGQHGSQFRTRYTLVFVEVEDSKEKHTAIMEGAMEYHCQATHKLFKTDLTILEVEKNIIK